MIVLTVCRFVGDGRASVESALPSLRPAGEGGQRPRWQG
jgi:hypothetical protein